ncbi:hypothetical protein QEN19_003306 [Hanseniaspora menglaensis]
MYEDNQQDESDEFFEANSSLHDTDSGSDTNLNLAANEKIAKQHLNSFESNIQENSLGSSDNRNLFFNFKNQHNLPEVNSPIKKKSLGSNRKDSNNSNQSTISIKDETKKNGKKISSSGFSKIKFRDRSNTKNSNASSTAIQSDSTTNNIRTADINSDDVNFLQSNDTNSEVTNTSINHSLSEGNHQAFDTTISDTSVHLLNALEEQDERLSPLVDMEGNNFYLNAQAKKGAISFANGQQPKASTMSKYRSVKFSSTLTNLLPNISAKLHHVKNKNQGDSMSQPSTPNSEGIKFFNENDENIVGNNQSSASQEYESIYQPSGEPGRKKLQVITVSKASDTSTTSQSPKVYGNSDSLSSPKDNSTSTKSKILAMMGSSGSKKQVQLQKQIENEKKAEKAKQMLMSSRSNYSQITKANNENYKDKQADFSSNSYSQQPIPFPKANDSSIQTGTINQGITFQQINNQDNQVFLNRTRANTVSSQITSLSNVASYPIWNNFQNQDVNSFHYDVTSALSSNVMQQYNMNQVSTLSPPAATASWRPRSKSNVSNSMMTDADYSHTHAGSFHSLVNTNNVKPKDFHFIENSDLSVAPIMQDDVEPNSFNWITNFPYAPKINYVNNFLQPTNTICVSNIFSIQKTQNLPNFINLTSYALHSLFSRFGEILTVKTLYGLNLALIEFKNIEFAKNAVDSMNGKLISTSIPSDVVFAKIIPLSISLDSDPQNRFLLTEQLYNASLKFITHGQWTIPVINGFLPSHKENDAVNIVNTSRFSTSSDSNANQHHNHNNSEVIIETDSCPFELPPPNLNSSVKKMDSILNSFAESNSNEQQLIKSAFDNIIDIMNNDKLSTDPTNYGPQPSTISSSATSADGKRKIFDSPTLRDLRKALDNKNISKLDIEQICICMLDEIAELCSDYLGNTIIQRIFESASPLLKNLIVNNCSQYLTSISVHKNGTWAAQKIISESSDLVNNKIAIVEGIKPYCLPLFTDQFGNYVIQCCLKYGPPFNYFIYDNIIKNFWEIVKSRFGSRAVRAVLENSNIEDNNKISDINPFNISTKKQLYSVTCLVVLYCEYLATNPNGTLLLTWYLDTCTIQNRTEIISRQMVPNVVLLSTHKLASLTIIKLLNQRKDDGKIKSILLNAIFGNIETDKKLDSKCALVNILGENKGHGSQFILKVLSSSLLDLKFKQKAIIKLHEILVSNDVNLKAVIEVLKKDKKFIEELGLGTSTPVSTSFEEVATGSTNRRTRTLSHVFKDGVNNLSGEDTHLRTNSMSSNATSNRKRGYSISQRTNAASSGSIWD